MIASACSPSGAVRDHVAAVAERIGHGGPASAPRLRQRALTRFATGRRLLIWRGAPPDRASSFRRDRQLDVERCAAIRPRLQPDASAVLRTIA